MDLIIPLKNPKKKSLSLWRIGKIDPLLIRGNHTHSQNKMNLRVVKGQYKGVHECKDGRKKKFRASIGIGGKTMNLPYFYSPKEAARCYDKVAKEHFGEYAWLNFPDEIDV
jgi:hypothetical protein